MSNSRSTTSGTISPIESRPVDLVTSQRQAGDYARLVRVDALRSMC